MASLEYITKRIEGKKKEIQKLESKLSRIRAAADSGWTVNPYYYRADDLKWTERDLNKARESLAKLEADHAVALEKENSRNVPAILEFLDRWKERVFSHYEKNVPNYHAAYKKYHEEMNALYTERRNRTLKWDEYSRRTAEMEKEFRSAWGWLGQYIIGDQFQAEALKEDLDQEAKLKYDDIIERTNEICGEIKDASGLSVGGKGELNGIVYGTRGNARIQTIGAGGYNIQCFHFRTLIHKI